MPASLFGAGSDTTASTLCSAILMLVTNPLPCKLPMLSWTPSLALCALPPLQTRPSWTYIKALCAEILHIRPVTVLGGLPHANSASNIYPNPHHFNPLRFLPDSTPPESLLYMPRSYMSTPQEKGTTPHPSKDGHGSFGWGCQICPEAGLAQNSLFITLGVRHPTSSRRGWISANL